MSVVKIIMRERKPEDSGPYYVTICMAKHWSRSDDGFMVTSGTWDATKFAEDDTDAELFCNHLNSTSKGKYFVSTIDECHLATRRHEYWEDSYVNCGFKENKTFQGVVLDG